MAGEAIEQVVLAAVRLVGDHHDVAPIGELRVSVAPLLGQELLDGGKDHPTCLPALKQLAQLGAALGLDRILSEEVAAAGEDAEELPVQVVAVSEDDDGRVLHRGVVDDPARVEGHRQALARALGVPDHVYATITLAP